MARRFSSAFLMAASIAPAKLGLLTSKSVPAQCLFRLQSNVFCFDYRNVICIALWQEVRFKKKRKKTGQIENEMRARRKVCRQAVENNMTKTICRYRGVVQKKKCQIQTNEQQPLGEKVPFRTTGARRVPIVVGLQLHGAVLFNKIFRRG